MDTIAPDDVYWHCYVAKIGGKSTSVLNDAKFEEIQREIIQPWLNNQTFTVNGMVISSKDQLEEIQIVKTPHPKETYADQHNREMRASGIADMATDRRMLPFSHGEDFTNRLLFSSQTNLSSTPLDTRPEIELLLRLCRRLPRSAKSLAQRKRSRPNFEINDEYDVQDLLLSVIRAYFKYAINEEPIGKVAGGKSSRADFAIEDLGALIEVKYARGPDDQSRLIKEFAEDLLLYTKWAPLTDFIFVIYNSEDVSDPESLDQLAGVHESNGKRFLKHIIRA
ncbi:MAG: hypothetical protein AAFX54_03780 [Pseudomonadota bacterium]